MALVKEEKKEIVKSFGKTEKDTGSTKVQIALLTKRINNLNLYLKEFKKDFHCLRGLMKLIGKRRRLLNYLKRKQFEQYKMLLKSLNIRK